MKVEKGHIVRVFGNSDNFSGVVHNIEKISDGDTPQYKFTIYRHTDEGEDFVETIRPNDEYKNFQIINIGGMTTLQNRERIARLFENMKDPKFAFKVKSRKKIARKGAVSSVDNGLKPNTDYKGKYEVFVSTRDEWFKLERTTKKMAFFEGGRCLIENITRTREVQ